MAEPSVTTGHELEALADAEWWRSNPAGALDLRHRAYAAYVAERSEADAGMVAARLAVEHFMRGEHSVGAGFLTRAHRHVDDLPEGEAMAFVMMIEANVARFAGDVDRSLALADGAIALARAHDRPDVVAMAVHNRGLALIDAGHVAEGLPYLDEAMASVLAGGIAPFWTGIIYCDVIAACLELGDVRRAGEWSDAAKAWCETLTPDAPYQGMCRVNRAEVARLRGAWSEAEAEATLATRELAGLDPSLVASAFQQVGEIRRVVGDLAGAEAAFERAQELGADPEPGLGLVRLAQRKLETAMSALRLALSREERPPRRVRLLAAQVEAALVAGELEVARAAMEELDGVAAAFGMPTFGSIAATVGGAVALAEGDVTRSVESLRRAVAAWHELRLPYETARARALLGRALFAAGDDDGARIELRTALGAFERLGARPDVEATAALLGGPSALPAGLTAREAEVLRLVAEGRTNRDIAVELVISEHTVGRHLQNIYAKLGVSTRAAATAYAYEHGLT